VDSELDLHPSEQQFANSVKSDEHHLARIFDARHIIDVFDSRRRAIHLNRKFDLRREFDLELIV